MTPDEWRQVKATFDAALEAAPAAARQIIGDRCAGNATLEAEVLGMLDAHQRAETYLEGTAADYAGAADPPAPQRLGIWQIHEEISQGGMATVYRAARDDREYEQPAAVKVLRPGQSESARRQFLRERQLLASLKHPNIVTLFDGGITGDGRPYLVEELVDGPAITEFADRKNLSDRERIELILPVCQALAYAHACGVVHRDVKPSNILVNSKGIPTLVDFGIAKRLAAPDSGPDSVPDSVPDGAPTRAHERYLTPEYASPEQIRGEPATARSDLYSRGLVLYELVSRRRAFAPGASYEQGPDLRELRGGLQDSVREVIRKAVAKDPSKRYADPELLAQDLTRVLQGENIRRPRKLGKPLLAVAAVVALAALFSYSRMAQPLIVRALTALPGIAEDPSLSPDGKSVVFAWNENKPDVRRIFRLDGLDGKVHQLTNTSNSDTKPRWSRDGKKVAFVRYDWKGFGHIMIVSPEGGLEREVGMVQGEVPEFTWRADSSSMVAVDRERSGPFFLFSLVIETGARRVLTSPPAVGHGDRYVSESPDGRWLAFARFTTSESGSILVIPAAGGTVRVITHVLSPIAGLTWTADGRSIVYSAARKSRRYLLWKVRAEEASVPEVLPGVEGDATQPSTSFGTGTIAYQQFRRDYQIFQHQTETASARVLVERHGWNSDLAVSNRGKIGFISDQGGTTEIFVGDTLGGAVRQLTHFEGPVVRSPSWSPDESKIAFVVQSHSQYGLQMMSLDGEQNSRVVWEPYEHGRPSWSRNGSWIYFRSTRSGGPEIWKIRPNGRDLTRVTHGGGYEGLESQDGQYFFFIREGGPVSVTARETPVYRMPIQGGDPTIVANAVRPGLWVPVPGGIAFLDLWRNDGFTDLVLCRKIGASLDRVFRIPVRSDRVSSLSASPDGRTFYWTQREHYDSGIRIVEGL